MVLSHITHTLGGMFLPKMSTFPVAISSIKKKLRIPSGIIGFRPQTALICNDVTSNITQPTVDIDISYVEAGTRIVTDIDDTVKSSGGVKLLGIPLGGIDVQYHRGVFYPGAFQFAFELTHSSFKNRKPSPSSKPTTTSVSSSTSSTSSSISLPPKVAVLTARAKEFKFALAIKPSDKISSAYKTIGETHGFENWGIGQVYYGSVKEWILQKRKGLRKFKNFEIMMENDAIHNHIADYILIGDTGEKDEDAGERIAMKYGTARMKAIFLHVVSDNHVTIPESSVALPLDRVINHVPIYYFRTYVGAATKAYKHKLIGADGVNRVVKNALEELKRLDVDLHMNRIAGIDSRSRTETLIGAPYHSMAFSQSRWRDLDHDIKEAKASMKKWF